MKKTSTRSGGSAKVILRKNLGYILLIIGVLIVAAAITLAVVLSNRRPDPIIPIDNTPVTFGAPVANYTLGDEASLDMLVYSSSMNNWTTHNGVDFICDEGTQVFAVMGGKVTAVKDTALDGMTITIEHEGGIVSIYKALASETLVEEGATVVKGQAIGTVAASSLRESKIGSHLHLEMKKDGEFVDPAAYIEEISSK